jgi:hypothetical protein
VKKVRKIAMAKIVKRIAREQVGMACIGRNRVHQSKRQETIRKMHRREIHEGQRERIASAGQREE